MKFETFRPHPAPADFQSGSLWCCHWVLCLASLGRLSASLAPATKPPCIQKSRLEQRRKQQQTEAWKKEYAKRTSGQGGVNRAFDRVTGINYLILRGKQAVRIALYLQALGRVILVAGWTGQPGLAAPKKKLQPACKKTLERQGYPPKKRPEISRRLFRTSSVKS